MSLGELPHRARVSRLLRFSLRRRGRASAVSLWSNDGQVAEAALVGLWVILRRVGRNGGPKTPIHPAPLEATLRGFVAGSADVDCWVDEDGVYWHAELRW